MADQLDTPGAHKALVQILAATPNSPEAHYHLGRVLLSYDPPGYEEAIKHLEFAVGQEPAESNYHLWLARAWGMKLENSNVIAAALGPVWRVKKHFEEAVRLDPSNEAARVDLFQYYLFAPEVVGGGREKALAQLQALYTGAGDSPLAHTAQAILAVKDSDLATASIEYERVAQLLPSQAAQAHFQMGFIYLSAGQYDAAGKSFRRALDAGGIVEPRHQVLLPGYVRNVFFEKAKYEIEHNVRVAIDSQSLSREARITKREEKPNPILGRLLEAVAALYERSGQPKLSALYSIRAKQLIAEKPKP